MNQRSNQQARVGVLGAGLMGHGIAQAFMVTGFDVAIWDPVAEVREQVEARIRSHLDLLGSDEPIRLRICTRLEDCVAGCDLVVEAAPENMALKRQLVAQVDAVNTECVLATNTSVLRITEIAQASEFAGRVVGTHWWNPPYLMPLVEVVRGERTTEAAAAKARAWLVAAGKTPVDVFKDAPGFVGNRMQFALLREALHIVEEGICSPETVDLVARLTFGRRLPAIGPLRNSDFVGLDLVKAIMDYLGPSLADGKGASALVNEKVSAGTVGAKTNGGIYAWSGTDRADTERALLEHLIKVAKDEQRG